MVTLMVTSSPFVRSQLEGCGGLFLFRKSTASREEKATVPKRDGKTEPVVPDKSRKSCGRRSLAAPAAQHGLFVL